MEKTTNNYYKLRLSAILGLTMFAYYLNFTCLPQTLNDLQESLAVTKAEISQVFSSRGFAYFAGTFLFGWLYGVANRQYLFSSAVFLLGLCMVFIPRVPSLWAILSLTTITGILNGGIDIACNVLILEMWGKESNRYLQGIHLCSSIGSLVSPLLSSLFVTPQLDKEFIEMQSQYSPENKIQPLKHHGSQIGTLYLITGSVALMASVAITVNEIFTPYSSQFQTDTVNIDENGNEVKSKEKNQMKSEEMNTEKPSLSASYHAMLIIMGALLYCFHSGVEVNTLNFLPAFLIRLNLGITPQKSSLMAATLMAASAVLRIVGFFVANKVRCTTILGASFVVILVSNLTITFFAVHSELVMWISIVVLGFGFSMVTPTLFSYFGEKITVTNAIASLFLFFTSVIPASSAFFIGKVVDQFPLMFMFFVTTLSVITLVVFCSLLMLQIYKRNQKKCKSTTSKEQLFVARF